MEKTFCDLRLKEVINQVDGKRLGKIIDMLIDTSNGKICGIIVPGEHNKSVFKRNEEIFIPWNKICKIGDDVILVKLGECKKDDKKDDCKDRCDHRDCDRCEHNRDERCEHNRDCDRCDHRDDCNCSKDKNRCGDFKNARCFSIDDDSIRVSEREY